MVIVHNTTTSVIVVPKPGGGGGDTGNNGGNNNGTNEDTVTFKVGITRVLEITSDRQIVGEYSLVDREFKVTHENMNSSEVCSLLQFLYLTITSHFYLFIYLCNYTNILHYDLQRWNSSINFPNGAVLNYSTWVFYEPQTITFANLTIPVTNYTVKYLILFMFFTYNHHFFLKNLTKNRNIVDLRNWNFGSFSNQLVIEYEMGLEGAAEDACADSSLQQDENQNVYYFTCMIPFILLRGIICNIYIICLVSYAGLSLYCQLVDAIILDDRVKVAQFKVNDTNKLQVIVPHFWDSVGMYKKDTFINNHKYFRILLYCIYFTHNNYQQ